MLTEGTDAVPGDSAVPKGLMKDSLKGGALTLILRLDQGPLWLNEMQSTSLK